MDYPPIVVEVQRNINKKLMRRAVGYYLQTNLKFDREPVLLYVLEHFLKKSKMTL
ncbi:hypothetical protein BDF21DRAFT_413840 [Thamnidium elegans]|nr:hypothetical protein BDF21DRAFT_413840 [Thamnidium elegans]